MTEWATTVKTNAILADIYDQMSLMNSYLRTIITKRPVQKPEPYKRPGDNKKKETRRIGSGSLPASKMREWIENRRR